MKLEAQTSVPSLYFLLFSRNKVKIVFFCLFPDLSVQYKNILKIKVLRMTCQFNMIFSGIFEDLWNKEHTRGTSHEGGGRAPCLVGPRWPSSTYSCTHTLHLPPPKHENPAQTRVQARFVAIFYLLAQSTSHKAAWGDCSLVCDSSIGPISFCSSALFIANLCCTGDHVLELACQIYMVPSSSNAWYRL